MCKKLNILCVCRGPGQEGIAPAEASDRLQSFQAEFDELWRKYTTYSGGEELFGLPVNGTTDCLTIILLLFPY